MNNNNKEIINNIFKENFGFLKTKSGKKWLDVVKKCSNNLNVYTKESIENEYNNLVLLDSEGIFSKKEFDEIINNSIKRILNSNPLKQKKVTKEEYEKIFAEGLIITHSVDKVKNHLFRFFNDICDVLTTANGIFTILFKGDEKPVDHLIKYMNNMGYFLSAYIKNGVLTKNCKNMLYCEGLRFEPKFDLEIDNYDRYLYHVTDKKHLNKILKIGLTPKTKSKLTNHPDRIYLAINKKHANEIKQILVANKFIQEPIMLKIDTFRLHNKFFVDSQFKGGIYTMQNIPPYYITVVN